MIKNNIATQDKMNNTAGSWSLLGATVPRDSAIARKLREAGAIILGKTNLSQWANFRSNNSSNGWSALGGQVYAAYYPNQDPSGSSSGSGVASSLGLALACLGTETDGSIVSPSSQNNLVGIKPSMTSSSFGCPSEMLTLFSRRFDFAESCDSYFRARESRSSGMGDIT